MTIRAQVTFQGPSLLPEDQYVNTFHFAPGALPFDEAVAAIHPDIEEFYNVIPPPATNALSAFLSTFIESVVEVKYYDLEQPTPRVPIILPFALDPPAAGLSNFPEEVAVCLSLRGAPPITPRRRGRLFIGPLNSFSASGSSTGATTRVSTTLITTLVHAAERLRLSQAGTQTWQIRSVTPVPNMVNVEGGFIDNSFDTQRRRGAVSSARSLWPPPP